MTFLRKYIEDFSKECLFLGEFLREFLITFLLGSLR
jgi:hypothetical protein